MHWVNIDFPTKKFTIHKESCSFVQKNQTELKGMGSLLQDGGWLTFKTLETTLEVYEEKFKSLTLKKCGKCL